MPPLTIKPGDTFLSIAEREGVPLQGLLAANPGVTSLNTGGILNPPTPAEAVATMAQTAQQRRQEQVAGERGAYQLAQYEAGLPPTVQEERGLLTESRAKRAAFQQAQNYPQFTLPQELGEAGIQLTVNALETGYAPQFFSQEMVSAIEGLSPEVLIAAEYVFNPVTGLYEHKPQPPSPQKPGKPGGRGKLAKTGRRARQRRNLARRGYAKKKPTGAVKNPYVRGGTSPSPAYNVNWRASFAK
jgi:hypothetical protein